MDTSKDNLYTSVLYNILSKFKNKIKFRANEIYYDNIELVIESSNLDGIEKDDFTISFQKQNGSFTLITNKNDLLKFEIITRIIEEAIGINFFATYSFIDKPDITITHWCYDNDKVKLNTDTLDQFKKLNEIVDLNYNLSSNMIGEIETKKV